MKKLNKRKLLISVLVIVFVLIAITWQFPFSTLSLHKQIRYNPDNIVMGQYLANLDEFTQLYEDQPADDYMTAQVQSLMKLYELPWLNSKETAQVDQDVLSNTLFKIQSNRKIVTELIFREEYDQTTKMYLQSLLENILRLEEEVIKLKHSQTFTKNQLKRVTGNVHGYLWSHLDAVKTFYTSYKSEYEYSN
ncbi:hypothetical protein GMD78_09855 [Ornithinibacillus sp. L9]|uniref:Uncharacterized protein n=1 Tax=Ornithinibacillus caprae TaxID=2678566 RepID=A0A6N8FGW3_9BACI|nr:hypothetical protein [Ornithinibacillus caprae]MUK88695.1 hypothetical protein [Ornithinibacillus caprae]